MTKRLVLAAAATSLLTAIATLVVVVYLYERPSFDEGVQILTMESEILGEKREMIVHLPEGYDADSTARYPVVYVLDGSSQDVHTAHSAALMARIEAMPEVIVVGLPNTSGENRQRDFTPPFMRRDIEEPEKGLGAGDDFLAFIEREAVPTIDAQYRTEPTRMLAGHSRGGLLVAYSLLEAPDLFSARFAHSPALWRDDQEVVSRLDSFLTATPDLDSFLYLSMGTEENDKMKTAFDRMAEVLEDSAPDRLVWHADYTQSANHGNNPDLATPVGFQRLYEDRAERVAEARVPLPLGE